MFHAQNKKKLMNQIPEIDKNGRFWAILTSRRHIAREFLFLIFPVFCKMLLYSLHQVWFKRPKYPPVT